MVHYRFHVALMAMMFVLIGGCHKEMRSANVEAETTRIRTDEKARNEAFRTRNDEDLVSRYAENANLVLDGKKAQGSLAIRKFYADASADPAFNIGLTSADIATSGDLAYSRGEFSRIFTDPKTGKVMTGSGSYLTVYRKQENGDWQIVDDFDSTDAATVKAVPSKAPPVRAKMISF